MVVEDSFSPNGGQKRGKIVGVEGENYSNVSFKVPKELPLTRPHLLKVSQLPDSTQEANLQYIGFGGHLHNRAFIMNCQLIFE